jgi:hypothetical protein
MLININELSNSGVCLCSAVIAFLRNASLGRKMYNTQPCIPLGMQVLCVAAFSTERYSLSGIRYDNNNSKINNVKISKLVQFKCEKQIK